MRNVAISLLLADSASAQKADDPMAKDKAVPAPILIADAWSSAGCVDTAVTAANTAVTTADAAWKKLVDEKAAKMDKEVTDAVAAKKKAVDAVIAKDAAIADLLKADDTEQQAELTAKIALDAAIYAMAAATSDKAAKDAAKTAADSAVTAAQTVQTAMNTAKTAADAHLAAETTELNTDTTAVQTALTAKTNAVNAISGLQTLYNNAKTTSDGTDATTATKLEEKEVANALKTKTEAALTAATTALDNSQAGTVAKTLATETGTLATKKTTLDGKRDAWKVKALDTVAKMKLWLAAETYTKIGTNKKCESAAGSDIVNNAANSAANCKTACNNLKAWGMSGNFPVAAAGTGTGHCYGYEWSGSACKIVENSTVNAESGTNANYECHKRVKSGTAAALVTANDLSKTGVTLMNEYDTALTAWVDQGKLVDAAQGKVDIATQYKTKVSTDKTAKDSASSTADTNYTNAKSTSDANAATTNTKLTALNTGKALVTSTTATHTLAVAKKAAQENEKTYQTKIAALALKDKTAQDTLVTNLQTAATNAKNAADTAATTLTTKTNEKGTKQTTYDGQVTKAAATAAKLTTPLSELKTLRDTAATATTTLNTKIGNQTAQAALIATAAGTLATEKAKQLAAVVACKEAAFDKYWKTLETARATRTAALATIKTLVEKAKPAAGKAGSRCEKALSNGTGRPKRGEKTCDEGLCCGAAKIPVGKAMMTIETCQAKDAKTYDYVPPRAPMATTPPSPQSMVFTCIEGAKKVAATASALAAALYMMA